MHFITVYDEAGTDHLVNVAHIVRVSYTDGRNPPVVHLTNGAIRVYGTPTCMTINPAHEVHQSIIDQLTAIVVTTTERNQP